MSIPFQHIPQDLRVPLFYAEVDNSRANTSQDVQRTLIIGQITSAGTAVPNIPMLCSGIADAKKAGGPNSHLAHMVEWYRKRDPMGELWYLPISDDPAAVAATGSLRFSTPASASGVLSLYIAGRLYSLPVQPGQTNADLAIALAALVSADTQCPVTAAVDGVTTSKVNFTAVNKGTLGNGLDLRVNYLGVAGGESLPPGMAVAINAMSNGATDPSMDTGLVNVGGKKFDFIVCPYPGYNALEKLKTFMNDDTGRWSYSQQLYGHVFTARNNTLGSLVTFGVARNNQHETVFGYYDSPTPSHLVAANVAGAVAVSVRADPALPLHTLQLDMLAPPLQSRFVMADRNTLLHNGISTFTVAADGTVAIENLITTYQTNSFGAPDNSYLEVETLYTLMAVMRRLRGAVTSKYARTKLAADGTRFAPGSAIVTPSMIKAELIAQYRDMEYEGLVQNADAFKAGLVVQQNAQNPNRVDVLYPAVLIDQLRIFATLLQFRLI